MSRTGHSAGSTPGLGTLVELPSDPSSPSRARRYAQRVLADCSGRLVDIAAVLVTELAANVVKHARTSMRVGIHVDDDRVRIEVADGSPDLPAVRSPRGATTGRGLLIVERLADAWGVDPSGEGKTVWAELNR